MISTDFEPLSAEEVRENIKKAQKKSNPVEHPSHYNREGAMECLDEMILVFGEKVTADFCLCNSWKYRYRAADKNGEEDLRKSDWYLAKYKELTSDIKTAIANYSAAVNTLKVENR